MRNQKGRDSVLGVCVTGLTMWHRVEGLKPEMVTLKFQRRSKQKEQSDSDN